MNTYARLLLVVFSFNVTFGREEATVDTLLIPVEAPRPHHKQAEHCLHLNSPPLAPMSAPDRSTRARRQPHSNLLNKNEEKKQQT